jgi:DNA excision repair protein ERCC-2
LKKIKIALSDFAQPLLLTGSIRREGMMSSMELGARIHKKIQLAMARNLAYKAEVTLRHEFPSRRFIFDVSGRADGIIYGDEHVIEEIKSTLNLDRLKEEIESDLMHPYRLQALTYAWILHQQINQPVTARLRLVSLKSKKEHLVYLELNDLYQSWLEARIRQLEDEERLRIAQRRKRKGIARTITFPFDPPRPHQAELAEFVHSAAKKGGYAMIQAPTGIGKTMGVLFPVLKTAFARGNPAFYLTPKNSQFDVAADAVKRICTGRSIKTRVLTAKRKLCRKEFVDCNPGYCEYAKSYHDKMREYDIANQIKGMGHAGPDEFLEIAEKCQVCPYQVQMDTLKSADLVIGDYNYVFSPNAGLSPLFFELEKSRRPSLIVDEVHNLYSRGMEYYSPALDVFFFGEIKRGAEGFSPSKKIKRTFNRLLNECIALISGYRPASAASTKVAINSEPFLLIRDKIHALLIDYISETDQITDHDPILEFYRAWASFTDVLEVRADETESAYIFSGSREYLQLICCDPSRFLAATMDHFHSVTGFSATIKPFDFYRRLSGFPAESATREFPSGFPDDNRKVLIIPQVSTTWRERQRNYKKIAEAVVRISREQPGNYLVFLPSYEFLARIQDELATLSVAATSQRRDSRPEDLREMEQLLTAADTRNLILAVQGGALSEGVDFNSPHLKGAFIVGPAVPMVSFERELLREYYETKFGDGFSYAYAWPAMTRSIQASGRVIRDSEKRGLIILMDGRFLQEPYAQSLPDFWYNSNPRELVSASILADVRQFWKESVRPSRADGSRTERHHEGTVL